MGAQHPVGVEEAVECRDAHGSLDPAVEALDLALHRVDAIVESADTRQDHAFRGLNLLGFTRQANVRASF